MPIDDAPAEGDAMHVVHVLSTLHVGAVDETCSQGLDSRANLVRACIRDGGWECRRSGNKRRVCSEGRKEMSEKGGEAGGDDGLRTGSSG